MNKKLSLILITSMLSLTASPTINIDNTWGCITKSKNTELNNALLNKDVQASDYLLTYSCVVLHKGQHITIIEASDNNYEPVKVRIYPENKHPMEIWVEPYYIDNGHTVEDKKNSLFSGCKYQSDLKKLANIDYMSKAKFISDNHCAEISNPSSWERIKKDKTYTLIKSTNKKEDEYWVKTEELPKSVKKKTSKPSKKKDLKSATEYGDLIMEYGDLIWQDSLINETKMFSYEKAYQYCKELKYKTITNWRLPTLLEFQKIRPRQNNLQPYRELKHIQLTKFYWTNNNYTGFAFSGGWHFSELREPALVRCVTQRK